MKSPLMNRAELVVFAGAATVVALIAAFAGYYFAIGRHSPAGANMTGTVQLARGDNTCRRLVIDNRTGAVTVDQVVACDDAGKEPARGNKESPRAQKEAIRPPQGLEAPRYSTGGRLDAVRNSFINR